MLARLPQTFLGALVLLAVSCGGHCGSERDTGAVAKAIAADLAAAYEAKVKLVECRAEAGGTACAVTLAGREPFVIDVSGFAEGRPVWKARGRRHMEYELARGIAASVRARPQAVSCPEDGELAAGFDCQVTFAEGLITPAKVRAAEEPERFVWTVPGLLMLGPIEDHIAAELAAQGEKVAVDCGRAVRQSVVETSFPCELKAEGGSKLGTVTVTVIDADGHVQYRRDTP